MTVTEQSGDQLKRAVDVVVSGTLLLALSPVIAVVAIAVAAERTGPCLLYTSRCV